MNGATRAGTITTMLMNKVSLSMGRTSYKDEDVYERVAGLINQDLPEWDIAAF